MREGINNRSYALVAMANKDTYFLDEGTYKKLLKALEARDVSFFGFTDDRKQASVTINLAEVSSLVELGDER